MWIVHPTHATQAAPSYHAVKHVQSLTQVCAIEKKKKEEDKRVMSQSCLIASLHDVLRE